MKLLSLDFDGVLHPAADSVLVNFRPDAPAWQIEIALKAQRRFCWAHLLVPILESTDVVVIFHTTWRKQFSDHIMKQFLPPEISSRVMSLDGQIVGRENLVADDYLIRTLELIQPTSVCVLDDRPEFFTGGKVQRWISSNSGCFVWTDAEIGIQSLMARGQLTNWSHVDPEQECHIPPVSRQ